MKKQLFGAGISALLSVAAAEAKSFDGAFVGANMGYKWEHFKGTAAGPLGTNTDISGLNASVLTGYGTTLKSVYVGGMCVQGTAGEERPKTSL